MKYELYELMAASLRRMKRNPITFLFLFLLLTTLQIVISKGTNVSLRIATDNAGRAEIFFAENTAYSAEQRTGFQIDASHSHLTYRIPIALNNPTRIRLDPNPGKGEISIKEITIIKHWLRTTLSANQLHQEARSLNDVSLALENDTLLVRSDGVDPYFDFAVPRWMTRSQQIEMVNYTLTALASLVLLAVGFIIVEVISPWFIHNTLQIRRFSFIFFSL